MIRHIVTWNYGLGFTDSENKENAKKIKAGLESLVKRIDGVMEITVHINELSSSNKDILLDSLFESEDALAAYQVHPEHKEVSMFMSTVLQNRACIDFNE